MNIRWIVSGGQSGVDRAALDAAMSAAIPCGGWCPRGRRAEDGPIPAAYPLQETEESGYRARTRRNVADSDGTLVMVRGPLRGGTAYTVREARRLGRPVLVLILRENDAGRLIDETLAWSVAHCIATLNVAGPRESQDPGIGQAARWLLDALCAAIRRSA